MRLGFQAIGPTAEAGTPLLPICDVNALIHFIHAEKSEDGRIACLTRLNMVYRGLRS